MKKQSGIASISINPESLTMIRTRFILEWMDNGQFPHKLFEFQQQLLREGLFPAYNQWLLDRRRTSPPIISGLVSTSRNTMPLSAYKKQGVQNTCRAVLSLIANQSNTKILKGLVVSRC